MKYLLVILLLTTLQTNGQYNAARWFICDTITYQDPENDENYLTITSGNTLKHWQIYPCSGILQVDTNAFNLFTYSKTYYLTITATDASGLKTKRVAKAVLKKPKQVTITMQ